MSIGSALLAFFHVTWRVLDGLRKVLHLILLVILFAAVIGALQTSIPIVPRHAALVVNPQGRIVEQLTGDPIDRAIADAAGEGEPETLLRDVIDAIEAAKDDKRIQLMVLDVSQMSGGGLRDRKSVV